jgi:hypothetical protein
MGSAAPIQTNFNGGELSPTIEGRVDINKYTNGCYQMRGFIPLVQGPARRRSGTRYVAPVKDAADRGWLCPFQFSDDTAFVLEFGDQYLRFFTNHGQLQTGAVAAWVTATAYSVGDMVTNAGTTYYCKTAHTSAALFATDAANWYALTGSIYEIPTPYAIADLTKADGTFRLWMEQSGDVIYITHPSYQTRKLVRLANTRWTLAATEFKAGPFVGVDPDETRTVYASAVTGTGITLTASAAVFEAGDVGSLFLLETKKIDATPRWEVAKVVVAGDERRSDGNVYEALNGATTGTIKPTHTVGARYDGDTGVQWEYRHSNYGWVRITGYTSPTVVTADVVSELPSQVVSVGNATTRWSKAEFSTARGWPSHVAFFRERLWLFRNTQAWASVASDFENFASRDGADVTPDMAIAINIASDQINDIAWVAPGNQLLVGTVGNEFAIGELTSSDPLGPANIQAKPQTAHGSRQVRPVRVNESILFMQRAGRKLREIRFSFESEGYATTDLTVLSDHVTKGQVVQMAYQQEPHSIVWCACADGSLLGFTFNREQDVLGWHPHPVGGDDAVVESVACIPAPDGGRDEVWMIVRRTIDGATTRYVEYMERDWIRVEDMEIQEAFFVDAGLTYDGRQATTLTFGVAGLLTAGGNVFSAGDVGDYVVVHPFPGDDETKCRFEIEQYLDPTRVVASALDALPADFDSVSNQTSDWAIARDAFTGADHLEGKTVQVLADGSVRPDRNIAAGGFTLTSKAVLVQVGLGFDSWLTTMRIEAGSQKGTAQGKTKRIDRLVFRFLDTLGGKAGPDADNLDDIMHRSSADLMDGPPAVVTGDSEPLSWPGGYETAGRIMVQQPQPLPMTLVAIMPELDTHG